MSVMRIFGNILWFLLGGVISGLSWFLTGLLWSITIIGIPYGIQCFKFGVLAFAPFGREIVYGGGAVSVIANIIWLLISGLWMAIGFAAVGIVFCITLIGIPFGKQYFKFAKLALLPFGATIV